MTRYFLGIDIGGTKSHALVADETGRALGFGEGGPGNPMRVGYPHFADLVRDITGCALKSGGVSKEDIAGVGLGIGGYDWPSQRKPILEALAELRLDAPVELANDAIIGLLAGAAEGWGVGVVAGTSCNAWGLDRAGRVGRMVGFSWLGEAAGSHELVLGALQAVARAWTLRGPVTRLTEAFAELAGVGGAEELLEGLTLGHIRIGSEAAPLVFRVAAGGDSVAQDLVVWAGRELGDMAVGIIRQLAFESEQFELVTAGSFFKGSPVIADSLRETVHAMAPGARLVRLDGPPVIGGVVLGMRRAEVDTASVQQVLVASTGALLGD